MKKVFIASLIATIALTGAARADDGSGSAPVKGANPISDEKNAEIERQEREAAETARIERQEREAAERARIERERQEREAANQRNNRRELPAGQDKSNPPAPPPAPKPDAPQTPPSVPEKGQTETHTDGALGRGWPLNPTIIEKELGVEVLDARFYPDPNPRNIGHFAVQYSGRLPANIDNLPIRIVRFVPRPGHEEDAAKKLGGRDLVVVKAAFVQHPVFGPALGVMVACKSLAASQQMLGVDDEKDVFVYLMRDKLPETHAAPANPDGPASPAPADAGKPEADKPAPGTPPAQK